MGILDFLKANEYKKQIIDLQNEKQVIESNLTAVSCEYEDVLKKFTEIKGVEYFEIIDRIANMESEYKKSYEKLDAELSLSLARLEAEIQQRHLKKETLEAVISDYNTESLSILRQIETQKRKLSRIKELYKSADFAIKKYYDTEHQTTYLKELNLFEIEEFSPSVMLKLHCMDYKDLKKAYKENEKLINDVLMQYSKRYTTKANKAIYKLMVISLNAELQNTLYNLKYEKLDVSVDYIKNIINKYLSIAGEGNQSILPTLTKFIGEIEYLFINAVKIEYNYYVKREQAKQEQAAIREQMRQEAEERKVLAEERKKIEKEETKFASEIEKLNEQIKSASKEEVDTLNARILELQKQLADVEIKKAEITALQNGKAGNVYIISNLGSFGDNIFKIGMTRRIDPQDRVNELGSASVPFRFDVHSFIFSDDAVSLESKLHSILNDKRVNKVNFRKEFFNVSIDELEQLVTDIEPTAEFRTTMIAEEYRQSISSDTNYTVDNTMNFYSDDDD